MYKDKEAQKAYNRERMRKVRVTQQGNTSEGNTIIITGNTSKEQDLPKGAKRVDYEGLKIEKIDEGQQLHPGAAPGAKILSDGQLWYPGNNGYHPIECRCQAHPDRTSMTDKDYGSMTHIL